MTQQRHFWVPSPQIKGRDSEVPGQLSRLSVRLLVSAHDLTAHTLTGQSLLGILSLCPHPGSLTLSHAHDK